VADRMTQKNYGSFHTGMS